MSLRPPISTRTDPLFPSPPLFRSPDPIYFKRVEQIRSALRRRTPRGRLRARQNVLRAPPKDGPPCPRGERPCRRSEEHTSELQSLMRISYAAFCLKKKKTRQSLTQLSTHNNTTSTNTETSPP